MTKALPTKPDYAAVEAAFQRLCDGCPLPLRVDIWIERHAGGEIGYTAMIQERSHTECSANNDNPMDAVDLALSKWGKAKRIENLKAELAELKGEK